MKEKEQNESRLPFQFSNCTRSEAKKVQAWHQPFTVLKAQMTIKASKDEHYTRFLTELKDIMADQEAFMNELYVWISECASLDKAEVTIFSVKNTHKNIYIQL